MILKRINWVVLGCALLLCGLGLMSLYTLSSPMNLSNQSITRGFLVKQGIFLGISLFMMVLLLVPTYLITRRIAYPFYALFLLTLVGLLIFGRYTRGARGWIPLGPINLQPAEFMKIATVLAIARWISFSRDLHTFKGMIAPMLLAAVPAAVIFAQPDLGNAMLFFPVMLALLYVGGAPTKWILSILLVVAVAVPLAYKFGMKPYQQNRLMSFWAPERVPREFSYQQTQSVKAVAAGGVTGRGLGESGFDQPFYVPDRHTDFVFSMIGEDCGLVGTTFLILIFVVLFIQAGRIAHRTREPYGRLLVIGLAGFMALQVFVNVGMNTGVAPITGLTLPFVSYGGSSLLTCFLSLALMLNVDARWVPTFSSRDMDRGNLQLREFCNAGMERLRAQTERGPISAGGCGRPPGLTI